MICPKCGAQLADGTKFCGSCGTPIADVSQPAPEVNVSQPVQNTYMGQPGYDNAQVPPQPPYQQPMPQKKSKTGLIILIIVLAVVLIIGGAIAWFVHSVKKAAESYMEDIETDLESWEDLDLDIEGLDDALDEIESLDLPDSDIDTDSFDFDVDTDDTDSTASSDAQNYEYGYTDVTIDGNDITIIPNGGLNGSTVLYGGKDLDGFLDYVDDTVLREDRYINRDFFYDLLSTMLVDESMYSNFDDVESNMIMCLAMADNFYNTDVRVKECNLDANNAAEYHYQVKAYDKDDTWIVNYGDRTVFFNDGKTEYSSDMFNDEYLAMWWMAIDEYYGHESY